MPLLAYGVVSILSLQRGTRESVVNGNQNVAVRAAEEIRRYVVTNAELLKALAADLQDTGLDQRQQDQILKNYVLQFREFREITLFDEQGAMIASSRVGKPRVVIPKDAQLTIDGVAMSPIRVDEDLLPTSVVRDPPDPPRTSRPAGSSASSASKKCGGWSIGSASAITASRWSIAPGGELIAHGDPDKKALVAQTRNMSGHQLFAAARARTDAAPVSQEYADEDGRSQLGVAARIAAARLDGHRRAADPRGLRQRHRARSASSCVAISVALLVMIAVGYFFGRSFINPILDAAARHAATSPPASSTRASTSARGDEFGDLGDAFNTMADRLVELQEEVKRQERQAMFGRIAAGLVHDLSHPIQNIGNSTRLLLRDDLDAESRDQFRRTIERELQTLKRFMDDLRNVVKPKPIERFAMDVNGIGRRDRRVDARRRRAQRRHRRGALRRRAAGHRGRSLRARPRLPQPDHQRDSGDRAGRPRHRSRPARAGDQVEISVTDTGSGIPADRLSAIFDDFVTTKRRGLGLGLAISKRIVEQLDGTIDVESEVGRGTAFTLRFPARDDRTAQAAAS